MPPVFCDARDLAERLGVRYDTVLSWVRRGKIPHVRDGRGRYLFNLNTVLEALRQKSLETRHAAAGGDGVRKPALVRKPAWMVLAPSGWPLPILRTWTDRPARGSASWPDPREVFPLGPTMPAGFGRPPEAPTPTPWPIAKQSDMRTPHLCAGESAPAKWEAIQEPAVRESNTDTRSTHDLCYTIMQQGKPHGRNR
jgi:excisionase family DNA binding protein